MKYLEYLKFPVASTSYIVLFFLLIFIAVLFIFTVAFFRSLYHKRKYKLSFMKEAFEHGLTEREAEILWQYSLKEGRDPFLTLEFKAAFEKVVDLYLKEDPSADENIVSQMREKLGFDVVPYFAPLVSTKDIELFQPAKVEIEEGYLAEIVLFDKDERYMYWAFVDSFPKNRIKKGDKITVTFLRKGDAIYKFSVPVEEVYEEKDRLMIKLPHTFNLVRYQRRNYARVEVDILCKLGVLTENGWNWYEGRLKDISMGGARICFPYGDERPQISVLSEVKLEFFLEGRPFSLNGVVVNEDLKEKMLCVGVEFRDVKESDQQFIYKFVKKEQKRLAELYVRSRE
ncbi:flagellar brake protein [Desulfurobacterium atlanticum]|uniref:C-di-GMP-binding flagellar brake protein YcgR, contains PilZNR and PilZ domains n=1 Tax=Desulfurobacterium atlanticum TaxID=240169 RepID=A0A238ZXG2_9BACT|nr:PilZ domain-containing protein [Desulfurobacterium atlanticum]SNR87822.1 c-di-GMP-binding flagellar brake protein YcgR, contains PilZNR and PilZ domains [Desulfurobacterium atlanticum]